MTTDDKTDSKPNENLNQNLNQTQTQTETIGPTDPTTTQTSGESDGKIAVIQTNSEQNCAQNNESLKDCHQLKDNKNKSLEDIHMKSAESLEDVMTAAQVETAGASASVDTTAEEVTESEPSDSPEETVAFKLVYNKNNYDIVIGLKRKVSELKEEVQRLTSVAPSMQKLLYKGIPLNDSKTLSETTIKNGVKVMLIGSKLTDVLAVNSTTKEDIKEEKAVTTTREPFCKQKQHKKVIDRGMPEDVMPAWRNGTSPLPIEPLHGMVNKYYHKVRLTFKLEQDQLWVGTKERTEKLSMMSIRSIVSEPIEEHPEYHLMGIQTGPTEASRIWIYWVPSQYIEAIKQTVLGK